MLLPNWLWPRERTQGNGVSIRLGRVIHWIFAALAVAMIAASITVAAVAFSTTQAWAQESHLSNQSASPNRHQPKPYVRGQTGTLADVVEQGPDLQSYTPAGPSDFTPPKKRSTGTY